MECENSRVNGGSVSGSDWSDSDMEDEKEKFDVEEWKEYLDYDGSEGGPYSQQL